MSVATALPPPAAAPTPAGVDGASARRAARRQGTEQGSFGAVLASHTPGSGRSHPVVPATVKRGEQERPARHDDPTSHRPDLAGALVAAAPVVPPAAGHAPVAAEPVVVPDATTAAMGGQQAPAATVPHPPTGTAGPDGAKPEDATLTSVNATSVNPTTVSPTSVEPTAVNATAVNATVVNATVVNPTAVNPTAVNPTAVKSSAAPKSSGANPKAVEPQATKPQAAGSGKANRDGATVPGHHEVANDVAKGQIANDATAMPQVPDRPGKPAASASSPTTDSTAPALSVTAGADPGAAGPSVPAATVHPGQVAPTAVVPAPAGAPAPAPAPAPAAMPVPVQQQVFAAVGPLLRADDGSYAVQLQLHPHDLGAVQVTVDVRHGEISVQLHSPDPAAQDALRDGLSDLRRQLEDQGLRTGSMEVGSGGADPRQRNGTRPQTSAVRVPASGALLAGAGGLVPIPAGSTALDLRM